MDDESIVQAEPETFGYRVGRNGYLELHTDPLPSPTLWATTVLHSDESHLELGIQWSHGAPDNNRGFTTVLTPRQIRHVVFEFLKTAPSLKRYEYLQSQGTLLHWITATQVQLALLPEAQGQGL